MASTGLLDPLQYTFTDSDIDADKDYLIQVKARNAVDLSSASTSLLIISAEIPSAPGQPTVIPVSTDSSQITVSWTASPDNGGTPITAYEVWYNQGPITNIFVLYSTVSESTLSETITTVTSGDPYLIRVVAKNRLGDSDPSLESTVYAASVPDAPNAPTRVPDTNSQTTIDIEWTTNSNGGSGITGYEVWWNGGGEGPVTGVKATLSAFTTAQISGLSAGTYYKFAIKAINVVGASNLSLETSFIAATIPAKPSTIYLIS